MITPEITARVVSCALDDASLYWMDGVIIQRVPYIESPQFPIWSDPRFFAGDFSIEVCADESVNIVKRADIDRAWSEFKTTWPHLADTLVKDEFAKPVADMFWQLCVFGVVFYG